MSAKQICRRAILFVGEVLQRSATVFTAIRFFFSSARYLADPFNIAPLPHRSSGGARRRREQDLLGRRAVRANRRRYHGASVKLRG
jgi:hypothetical protein